MTILLVSKTMIIQSDALVMGDPTQIHQILLNLCTNAGHAMQERGGLLEVSLSDVELDTDFTTRYPELKSGPYLQLTVSDNGRGIPEHILERIFDPFFTTKKRDTCHGITAKAGKFQNPNPCRKSYEN
jgi:signal transduction histidine kinase